MDPYVFYDDVRFFIKGYSEYKDEGGVRIESNPSSKLNYVGASSGRDPGIFLLKIILE